VIAIVSLFVVVLCSLMVVRVATVALTLTGLSRELARFQARSAFTGTGFTTSESEKVLLHPVRRRILMLLMLLGNAGLVTAITSLMLSFLGPAGDPSTARQLWMRTGLLAAGLLVLWKIAHSKWIDQRLSRVIARALRRWTDLELRDYAGLLHLSGDYAVIELHVEEGDWLADSKLSQLQLSDEGVLVLGIEKNHGPYLGAPRGETHIGAGDTVILYGPQAVLVDLDRRRRGSEGNWAHHKAVNRQIQMAADERQQEEQLESKRTD